jgi:hypothetical protein
MRHLSQASEFSASDGAVFSWVEPDDHSSLVTRVFAEGRRAKLATIWYLRLGVVFVWGIMFLLNKEFALTWGILFIAFPIGLALFRALQDRRLKRLFRPSMVCFGDSFFALSSRSTTVPYSDATSFRWVIGEAFYALDLQSEDGNFEFIGVPKSVDKTLVTTFLKSKGLRLLPETSDPETYLRQKLKRVEEEFIQKMHSQIHGS